MIPYAVDSLRPVNLSYYLFLSLNRDLHQLSSFQSVFLIFFILLHTAILLVSIQSAPVLAFSACRDGDDQGGTRQSWQVGEKQRKAARTSEIPH